jgi:hypothetical protein
VKVLLMGAAKNDGDGMAEGAPATPPTAAEDEVKDEAETPVVMAEVTDGLPVAVMEAEVEAVTSAAEAVAIA